MEVENEEEGIGTEDRVVFEGVSVSTRRIALEEVGVSLSLGNVEDLLELVLAMVMLALEEINEIAINRPTVSYVKLKFCSRRLSHNGVA